MFWMTNVCENWGLICLREHRSPCRHAPISTGQDRQSGSASVTASRVHDRTGLTKVEGAVDLVLLLENRSRGRSIVSQTSCSGWRRTANRVHSQIRRWMIDRMPWFLFSLLCRTVCLSGFLCRSFCSQTSGESGLFGLYYPFIWTDVCPALLLCLWP